MSGVSNKAVLKCILHCDIQELILALHIFFANVIIQWLIISVNGRSDICPFWLSADSSVVRIQPFQ